MEHMMAQPSRPTPYDTVNAFLRLLEARMAPILGDRLAGVYLSGSLALGDFDARFSDIDCVVVTEVGITEDNFAALRTMHQTLEAGESPWVGRVEVVYILRQALRESAPGGLYPQLERGRELTLAPLEGAWAIQRFTLREHGVVIHGPEPRALIPPVDPADLRQASLGVALMWQEEASQHPDWLDWLRQADSQAFVALTLCRLLYALETGGVASKPAAACWAREWLGGNWSRLIERSLARQHGQGHAPESDVQETIALVQLAVRVGWRLPGQL
jgi:hypothetical protein